MVILCDFDDTAADRNIATLLLERFQPNATAAGAPHWLELHRQFLNGEVSLARYQELAFSRLATPRAEQAAYVQQRARLRPGFQELAAYCAENEITLAIVSHGLDFYIQALLEGEGLSGIPYFAVKTDNRNGATSFQYDFARQGCDWWPGNCKCQVLQHYRTSGHSVIYAGDGSSDTCPAQHADYVFARDTLLRFCQARGLPHQELTDFHVLLDYLKSLEAKALA